MAGHLAMQEAVRAGTPHPHPTLGFLLSVWWASGGSRREKGVPVPSQTSGSPLGTPECAGPRVQLGPG